MSSEDRLAELERKVRYLTDRQEILDCISRTSRGNDRFVVDLIVGSYAEDGNHLKGSRDKSDPSYQRLLTLEGGERS